VYGREGAINQKDRHGSSISVLFFNRAQKTTTYYINASMPFALQKWKLNFFQSSHDKAKFELTPERFKAILISHQQQREAVAARCLKVRH
jgi:hypothetical protein